MSSAPTGPGWADEGRSRGRPELPPLPRGPADRLRPPRFAWRARLEGLGVVLLGVLGLLVLLALQWSEAPPALPGINPDFPAAAALYLIPRFLLPFLGFGSLGLIIVGLRRLVRP